MRPAVTSRSSAQRGAPRACEQPGGHPSAAAAKSGNAASTRAGVTWPSPKDRMPGVSTTQPPAGRRSAATGSSPSGTFLLAGSLLAVLCILDAGLLRRPWGITLGWALQLATFACAFIVPAMLAVG